MLQKTNKLFLIYPLTYDEFIVGDLMKIVVSTPEKTITAAYHKDYGATYRRWTQSQIFEKIYED
jgi:hypothetical protein